MNIKTVQHLLSLSQGIEKRIRDGHQPYAHLASCAYDYFKIGEVIPPKGVFVEVVATATAGTIGEIVGYPDLASTMIGARVYDYSAKFEIKIDGRAKTGLINSYHCRLLDNYTGPTKWVRNVKKHEKVEIPDHVNKYGQTIKKGDWVVGIGVRKTIKFGQVTNWTKSSINVTCDKNKKKTSRISDPRECFVLPDLGDEPYPTINIL